MPNPQPLLALIRKTETGKDDPVSYETVIGHKQGSLAKPITQMTVDEVLAAQLYLVKELGMPSGAAGAYQIIRKTLLGLKKSLGLTGKEKFTPTLQDRLGRALLDGRGYQKYVEGNLTATAFGNQLAREWASFPVLTDQKGHVRNVKIGQSYYAGDGINKALVRPATVAATLREVLADAPVVQPKPKPTPAEPVGGTPQSKRQVNWGNVLAILAFFALVAYLYFKFVV